MPQQDHSSSDTLSPLYHDLVDVLKTLIRKAYSDSREAYAKGAKQESMLKLSYANGLEEALNLIEACKDRF